MVHELKCDKIPFKYLFNEEKSCEIRYNDRTFSTGDRLLLRETKYSGAEMRKGKPLIYTGSSISARITHILYDRRYGLQEGFVCLSLKVTSKAMLHKETKK
jgi:hypothetical protein